MLSKNKLELNFKKVEVEWSKNFLVCVFVFFALKVET